MKFIEIHLLPERNTRTSPDTTYPDKEFELFQTASYKFQSYCFPQNIAVAA